MGIIEVTFNIDDKDYPMLKNFKKKELNNYIIDIFKTGYNIHFPNKEEINKQIQYNDLINKIKDEMNNSEISNKLNSLESSLTKLIGLSSNSNKKGNFAENVLEELFSKRYGDILFERKSSVAHSGDAWLHLPDDKIIILESKNYNTTINKDEIKKLESDMINHHIKWGILVSFNSMIQGMKEMDLYTFNHNNETYFIVMISNLSNDIHKLDLGIQIIRKLMTNFDNINHFPWIIKDINQSLIELNNLIQKNYMLRDNYYNMETEIQKQLSTFHVVLRDYQYEIEFKINEIINKIKSTIETSKQVKIITPYQDIIEMYKDKKINELIIRIVDIAKNKNWDLFLNENNEIDILDKDNTIGKIKVFLKKLSINIINNDLTIVLNLNKNKENKKNLEIIKLL